jgi:hypothetical protein
MSCTATTIERISHFGSNRINVEVPATTETRLRHRRFQLTDRLSLEIEFEGEEPPWLVGWMQRLSNILNLSQNWDSYGARRIKPSAVLGAINFFLPNMQDVRGPLPDIVPDRNGNIQLEWHIRNVDLEVEAIAEHTYRLFYERNGEVILDDVITTNPDVALQALREIAVFS